MFVVLTVDEALLFFSGGIVFTEEVALADFLRARKGVLAFSVEAVSSILPLLEPSWLRHLLSRVRLFEW